MDEQAKQWIVADAQDSLNSIRRYKIADFNLYYVGKISALHSMSFGTDIEWILRGIYNEASYLHFDYMME